MKEKWRHFTILLAVILPLLSIGTSVIADDGEDHDEEDRQEYYQEEDEDEDDNNEDEWDVPISEKQQIEFWNLWSRQPSNNPNKPLPISEPTEVPVIINQNKIVIYMIPQDGQILIPANEIAKAIGAKAAFYPYSEISVLSKGNIELIVKAGSNAVFENRFKTPMPIQAVAYENTVYLPISVAANAFGYRIKWNNTQKVMELQQIQ
ncbi:stalk domain-containing protein [Neobacillus sp. PS2-9]|uniref:stalk domain-containing protein n=1 Tax=Neobacillus sp. PS2-9 TaxID=3070676 RepID=UPI0027E1E2AF|nr:stalk domain-containing protein [Neobacillus sp. PS2-9]WML60272.1 stalk domain-containing protein [Neobacillus sp. PS2-9]